MTAISVNPPYPIFTDVDGNPLNDGYIYVGIANQNPEVLPVAVYWDSALTIPAVQPIRTNGGYPARNGTPSRVYTSSDYSITVRNKNGSFVYSAPVSTTYLSSEQVSADDGSGGSLWTTAQGFINKVLSSTGSSILGYIQAGLNRIGTTAQSKLREHHSVFDFMTSAQIAAVKAGTVVDVSSAVQTAIQSINSENITTLYFPAGEYYLATPIVIDMSLQKGLRLTGDSMAGFFATEPGGTKIYGGSGIESLFILTRPDLGTASGYSFECDHISFRSAKTGVGGALSAIKNKIAGAPARLFIVESCNFLQFDKAILSDLSEAVAANPAQTTGICQVILRKNSFVACNYSLYGTGGLGSVMDLVFCDSVSENGGKIYATQLGGTCLISDNLLEGQADAVEINMGYGACEIARNYFEANSGILIKITATNPASKATIRNNYTYNSAGSHVTIENCLTLVEENFEGAGVNFSTPRSNGRSRWNNQSVQRPMTFSFNMCYDLSSISHKTSLLPATLTGAAYVSGGGVTEVTPIGSLDVATLASGPGNWMTPAAPLNANDAIVATALVRRRVGTPFLYLAVYDNAYAYLTNTDTSQAVEGAAVGEWVVWTAVCKVTSGSGGNPRIRWVSAGGTVDIAATYFYSLSAPVANSTPVHLCLPNP